MHTVFAPGKAPENYNFEETCPHCDSCVPVLIDEQKHTCYEVTCPVCGQKMMLCTLCLWDNEDSNDPLPDNCDWSPVNGCHRQLFTIETYPPMMSDYENQIENPDYDDTIRVFSVPKPWVMKWLNQNDYTLDEFMSTYTWDDTFRMYEDATAEKVIISEEIKDR